MAAVKKPSAYDGFERASDLTPIALPARLIAELRRQRDAEERVEVEPPTAAKSTGANSVGLGVTKIEPITPNAAGATGRPRGAIALFDQDQAHRALEAVKVGRSAIDRVSLQKKLLGRLVELGPWRKVAKPGPNWRRELEAIGAKYPNAGELIELVTSQFALCERARRPLSIPPLLLDGPPGIGKTSIARAVCGVMRCPMHVIQVETACHASSLVGVELHWSSAGTGALYDALVEGPVINPVILLDELEKVQQRDDYPSLHKPLYALLERDSARSFRDACVPDVALDASHVRWIATSNAVSNIPQPILSRMQLVQIAALSPAQSAGVLRGIDLDLRRQYRLQTIAPLSEQLISGLARASPRRMSILLLQLYGRMVQRGAREPDAGDVAWLQTHAGSTKEAGVTSAATDRQAESNDALTTLLTVTNLAAMRALDLRARMQLAGQNWVDLVSTDVAH